MKKLLVSAIAMCIMFAQGPSLRADDTADTKAIVDKAIKALGGEEALSKVKIATWKDKGTITFNGADNETAGETTMQGLDHFRQVFTGEFNGTKFKGVTILSG